MNMKQLQFILQIVESQSFTKAAQELGVSQPYLSQYIANIEQQMGIVILDRDKTPIKLTHIGEVFCVKAKEMIKLYDDMILELNDIKGIRTGKITIGLSQAGASFIPKVVPSFHKKFPNVKILIKEYGSAKEIESSIIDGDIDIGALPLLSPLENLDYQIIQEKRMLLAIPFKHPIIKKVNNDTDDLYPFISLELLKDEQFILPEKELLIYLQLDKPFQELGFTPKISCTTKTMDVSNALVASGMGIGFTLPEMLKYDYKDKIKLFRIDEKHTLKQIVLAYRKGKYLSKVTKEFVSISKKILEKEKD